MRRFSLVASSCLRLSPLVELLEMSERLAGLSRASSDGANMVLIQTMLNA